MNRLLKYTGVFCIAWAVRGVWDEFGRLLELGAERDEDERMT